MSYGYAKSLFISGYMKPLYIPISHIQFQALLYPSPFQYNVLPLSRGSLAVNFAMCSAIFSASRTSALFLRLLSSNLFDLSLSPTASEPTAERRFFERQKSDFVGASKKSRGIRAFPYSFNFLMLIFRR